MTGHLDGGLNHLDRMKISQTVGTAGGTAGLQQGDANMTRARLGILLAAAFPLSTPALAQETQTQASPEQTTAASPTSDQAPPAQPAEEKPAPPVLAPSMTGPLKANSDPLHVDGGPLGPIYISGVISGLGLTQSNHFPGERSSRIDLSNGQVIVQTTQGLVQFYAQAGGYSIATLGTPYFKAKDFVRDTFGLLPVAYVKIVPSSDFNVQVGKLLTLQGAENAFTFQNFNIERGLLFNQTSTINRGVQANYAHGPLSFSLALTDGYYSKKYNWLSGTIGYALSSKDSITLGAAANLGRTKKSSFATPTVLNNGSLFYLSWTHNDGPWTIQPYVQVGHVPKDESLGINHSVTSYGAAVLGKYSFTDQIALAARAEIIKQNGSVSNGAPSLVYGPGSGAWSLTLTPTWQKGIFFARAEGSYVKAFDVVPGFGLGHDFDKKSQVRGLIEAGIIF
jgi:hypothetical protein